MTICPQNVEFKYQQIYALCIVQMKVLLGNSKDGLNQTLSATEIITHSIVLALYHRF